MSQRQREDCPCFGEGSVRVGEGACATFWRSARTTVRAAVAILLPVVMFSSLSSNATKITKQQSEFYWLVDRFSPRLERRPPLGQPT